MIINAYELKAGDVFIINTGDKGYKFVYEYTNSSVLQIQAHDTVELIKNIENNTR